MQASLSEEEILESWAAFGRLFIIIIFFYLN